MGKNKKNKPKKSKQNKKQGSAEADGDKIQEIDEASNVLGLSLELTDELKNKAANQENQREPDIEPNFESTEEKAREDMEQCEKLLGVIGEIEEPIDQIQERIEKERIRVKSILKDKEYDEFKNLTKKQKKNVKEIDSIFNDKRLNSADKLRQLYDIVMKTIGSNQKLKEKSIEEDSRMGRLRNDFEIQTLGIEKLRKQKHMLHNLFQTLKEKNIEAYRRKDDAIRDQQSAKKEMTKLFEKEIDNITNSYQSQLDIKSKYEQKKGELEKLAEEYKVLETQSKKLIEKKDKRIDSLQTEINHKIETELKTSMDTFNREKAKYDKFSGEKEQLNDQYKKLKDKFQRYISDVEIREK